MKFVLWCTIKIHSINNTPKHTHAHTQSHSHTLLSQCLQYLSWYRHISKLLTDCHFYYTAHTDFSPRELWWQRCHQRSRGRLDPLLVHHFCSGIAQSLLRLYDRGKLMRDQLSSKTTFCETSLSWCHVNDPLTRYHPSLETSFSLSVRAVIKNVFHCSSNYELCNQHDIRWFCAKCFVVSVIWVGGCHVFEHRCMHSNSPSTTVLYPVKQGLLIGHAAHLPHELGWLRRNCRNWFLTPNQS